MRLAPDKPPFDSVEIVAGNVLGATVIFLLFQVFVMIVFLVFAVLLPGIGTLSPAVGERLGILFALLGEAILVTYLVRMVRKGISGVPKLREYPVDPALEPSTFDRRLERMMILGAVCGIAWSLLIGLGPSGARIALMVIEAFTILFLLIVIATSWILRRRVSTVAVVALGATVLSLGLATGIFRP